MSKAFDQLVKTERTFDLAALRAGMSANMVEYGREVLSVQIIGEHPTSPDLFGVQYVILEAATQYTWGVRMDMTLELLNTLVSHGQELLMLDTVTAIAA